MLLNKTSIFKQTLLKSIVDYVRQSNEKLPPECDHVLSEQLIPTLDEKHCELMSVIENRSNEITTTEVAYERETTKLSEDTVYSTQLIDQHKPLFVLRNEFNQLTSKSVSSNFLKGCKWSPDGLCLLTNSDDKTLRLFEIPTNNLNENNHQQFNDLDAVLKLREPELIYDFVWYPRMNSTDPDSCCIFSTCGDNPVHLFDAYTGIVRCSYKAYDHLDELIAAHCIAFEPDGFKMFCGYNKSIRIFDINRPGQCIEERKTAERTSSVKQTGIISCIDFSQEFRGLYAAGSYNKSIGVYFEAKGDPLCILHGHNGGITHIRFSPDGNRLYTGARKDNMILCWDIRNPGELLATYERVVSTNQRIYFDFDPTFSTLVSGSSTGQVSIWDLKQEFVLPKMNFIAHNDCTNGISIHPTLPLLATSSGQRKFAGDITTIDEDNNDTNIDDEFNIKTIPRENCVKIWAFHPL